MNAKNQSQKQLGLDLFDHPPDGTIEPDRRLMPQGDVVFYPQFLSQRDSDRYFAALRTSIEWRQEKINLFGKAIDQPRLTAWYGDTGKSYTYSGITMQPRSWTPTLLAIKTQIETVVSTSFNTVLLNWYRDGKDSMGWHSDDEPELGDNPAIASISFGAARSFHLRHKKDKAIETIKISLTHGSLLLMQGQTQHFWQHQIPKTAKTIGDRINLTFRTIV